MAASLKLGRAASCARRGVAWRRWFVAVVRPSSACACVCLSPPPTVQDEELTGRRWPTSNASAGASVSEPTSASCLGLPANPASPSRCELCVVSIFRGWLATPTRLHTRTLHPGGTQGPAPLPASLIIGTTPASPLLWCEQDLPGHPSHQLSINTTTTSPSISTLVVPDCSFSPPSFLATGTQLSHDNLSLPLPFPSLASVIVRHHPQSTLPAGSPSHLCPAFGSSLCQAPEIH